MCIKRFALLVMSVCIISGFSATQVSAAESDSSTQNTDAVSQVTETTVPATLISTAVDMPTTTETPVVDDTVTTQPVVTTTSSPIATKAASKKTTKKSTKKSTKKVSYTKSELRLMASIINCEAGSESYQGKLAVGVVVMNRIKSKSFPNTLKKVIFQKYQFSPVRNGSLRKRLRQYDSGKTGSKQWKDCISAAKKTLQGQRTIIMKGKVKSLKGYHFFSVRLSGAKIRLGGHRFK